MTPTSPPPSESLAAQFTRLCKESDANPAPPPPALPGLSPAESNYIRQNSSHELYMSPHTLPSYTNPTNAPSILKAFRHAIAHTLSSSDPNLYQSLLAHQLQHQPPPSPTCSPESQSFASLLRTAPYKPIPQLQSLSWENSISFQTLKQFTDEWRADRAAQTAADLAEAQQAMARAQAAGAKPPKFPRHPRVSLNQDPVLWTAQEEACAASALRELRTNLSKLRKGSSKAPPEASALWALISQKTGKLKPEAAAEMARARVAAAAAVAAMKEHGVAGPKDSMSEIQTNFAIDMGVDHVRVLEGGKGDGGVVGPGFPRALSLDSGTRMRNIKVKKKKVGFAEGTVFGK